jgi:hypothetical protein
LIEQTRKPQPLPGTTQPNSVPSRIDPSILNGPITDGAGSDAAPSTAPPSAPRKGMMPPPPPGVVPGLQHNPNAPTQPPVSGRASPQNEAAGVRAIQDRFIKHMKDPEWVNAPGHAQVVDGMKQNGGRPQVIIENGKAHFVGADGQRY